MQDTESGEVEVDKEQVRSEADELSELKTRFRQLEADLLAQDHRAVPVLQTFFRDRRLWDRSDPRWKASWTAFIWWCLGGLATPAGAAVGLAAFLTLALTGWNAWEFRRQNEALAVQNQALAEQNATLKRQVDQQEADTLIVRRAQLLAAIYEEDCSDEGGKRTCIPRSHARARQEAALAFVEIERGRGLRIKLGSANLGGVDLSNADLSGAELRHANLLGSDLLNTRLEDASLSYVKFRRANLEGANLQGAELFAADLLNANLRDTNLVETNLESAGLKDAILREADLTGANLRNADLRGAVLSGARVTQDQLNRAEGDSKTKLPEGLRRPAHWEQ